MSLDLGISGDGAVHEVEGKTREYKRDLSSPRNVVRTLVAFANSAGGQLIVGVDDDRHVVGVTDPLAEEERLASLIADNVLPRLVPTVEIISIEGKALLVIRVALSGRRPHHVKAEGPDEGVYVRLGSTNRKADPPLIRELERSAQGKAFDQLPTVGQKADAIDVDALASILGRPVDRQIMRTLGILTADSNGDLIPSNGGILLAGRRREEQFPFAWVQCGRFRGNDKVDIFDQTEIHSHLPLAVEDAVAFLTKNAFKTAQFGEVHRKDVWSIPIGAIREIIINAIAHAAWGAAATPVRVAFMDDRIEVESPGGLMPGMTVEDMFAGVSQIRNPVIVRFFREIHLMEEWGSGVRRVVSALAQDGLGAPNFIELPGRLRVIIPIRAHQLSVEATPNEQVGEQVRISAQVHEQVSEQVPFDGQVSEQVVAILSAALEPTTRVRLLQAAGLSNAYGNYKRHLLPLIERGLLTMTIPDKPNSRLQQYQTTESGCRVLSPTMRSDQRSGSELRR